MTTTSRADRATTLHEITSTAAPVPGKVIDEITTTLTDLGKWITLAQSNEHTTLAQWDGQSADGRKWDKNYGRAVAPWDGSADTRVRLADASIDELVMLQMMAFFTGHLATTATEAHDVDAAGRVQTLLNYEIRQRMRGELWRELNFALNWKEGYGHAILHVGWHRDWSTGKEVLRVEDLAVMLAEQMSAETGAEPDAMIVELSAGQVEVMLADDSAAALALIQARYPSLPEARARRVLKQLRDEGLAEFRVPVEIPGRPRATALMPGFDVFYPTWCDDITRAPWVAMVETLSEPELRAKVRTEGWDEEFVERLLKLGPVPVVDMASLTSGAHAEASATAQRLFASDASLRFTARIDEMKASFQVLRVQVKGVDEDGVPALHEVVLHPQLSDGKNGVVAVNRLLDYYHEGGCFVDLRREYKTRALWESRGVPELAETPQHEVKALRDARLNRNEMATNPPVRGSVRRAPGKGAQAIASLGIMPGGFLPDPSADGRTDFMRVPSYDDEKGIAIEQEIRADHCNLLGLMHEKVMPEKLAMHRQFIVTGFLVQARELVLRILSLDQQFMAPVQVSRVIGMGPLPFAATREEIAGRYDVALEFDVRMLDMEYVKARWEALGAAFMNDRSGVLNDAAITRWRIASIDPNLADIAVRDPREAAEDADADEQRELAVAAMGVALPPKEKANPQRRLQTIQEQMQGNPKMAQLYQTDENYRAIVDARAAKYQFDLQQFENVEIGRTGWKAPEADDPAKLGVGA